MQQIIQTRQDLENATIEQRLEFLNWLKGAATLTVNTATYPEDYDNNLQEGDEGYVAPQWQEQQNLAVLERFGFSSIAEVNDCVTSQSE